MDPINKITNGQLDLGNFSVCIFLFYSGFFITKSMIYTKKGIPFFQKRIKRIIPALFITVLLTAFVVGPIFTTVSLKTYFTDKSPYLYVLKNTFLITTHNIIGLWVDNPYPFSTNGSLWTLPVEFLCYIACYMMYKMRLLDEKKLKYTLIPFSLLFIIQKYLFKIIPSFSPAIPLFMMFYMGMIYYIYKDKIKLEQKYFWFLIIITILSLYFNLYAYVKIFSLPYIFIYIGFNTKNILSKFNKTFKLSYEIYLVGFLIQQIVFSITKIKNPFINFALTIIPSIAIAFIINKVSSILLSICHKEVNSSEK